MESIFKFAMDNSLHQKLPLKITEAGVAVMYTKNVVWLQEKSIEENWRGLGLTVYYLRISV